MRWWRTASLRSRLILIGSAGVAGGLAIGGVVLIATLSFVLQRSLDIGLDETSDEIASLIQTGDLPNPIPVGRSGMTAQVLDSDQRVVAGSAAADRLVPLLRPEELRAALPGKVVVVEGERLGLRGPLRVAARSVTGDSGPRTVVVALSSSEVVDAVRIVTRSLLIAFPLLVLGLALIAWRIVGLTLRPVESLRRGAEEITGANADGRLPVPRGQDEVHKLAVTLNDMLGRLEAARRRQEAFVADAAHEFRSPLASMRTQLEVASRLASRTDWTETGADLLADVERLGRLTDDLLLLARADEGELPTPAESVDLGALVREAGPRYADARVPVVVDAPRSLALRGRADQLRRVIANLIDNAVRHATAKVALTARAEGPWAVLEVTDDGPGIAEADLERVFDRFTRLDDARARDEGGAGLGLAIVRELVRLHGGSVSLSAASPGVRAVVRLPRS